MAPVDIYSDPQVAAYADRLPVLPGYATSSLALAA